jgi:hypothetical protein
MTNRTREKWAERIREWRKSGLSAEEFTAGKDYAASSLRVRLSQFETQNAQKTRAESGSEAPLPSGEKPLTGASAAPRFVPVRLSSPSASEVVVEVAGARIRVSRAADLALVGDLVRALQGGGR